MSGDNKSSDEDSTTNRHTFKISNSMKLRIITGMTIPPIPLEFSCFIL